MLASLDSMFRRSWKYVPIPASRPHELAAYAMRWCPKPILMVPTYTVPPREDRMARRGAPPAAPPRRDIAAAEVESWLTLSLSTKEEGIASSWTGGLGLWLEDEAPKPAVTLIFRRVVNTHARRKPSCTSTWNQIKASQPHHESSRDMRLLLMTEHVWLGTYCCRLLGLRMHMGPRRPGNETHQKAARHRFSIAHKVQAGRYRQRIYHDFTSSGGRIA